METVNLTKPAEDIQPARDADIPFTLAFRAAKQEDLNFILSSWLRSYRDAKRTVKNKDYFPGQQRLIGALAGKRNLVIGCDADTPEWIAGYACGQMLDDGSLLLDYVYVKQPYRERGIGRALIAALGWAPTMPIVGTHWNRVANILSQKFLAEHNEYYLMLGNEGAENGQD